MRKLLVFFALSLFSGLALADVRDIGDKPCQPGEVRYFGSFSYTGRVSGFGNAFACTQPGFLDTREGLLQWQKGLGEHYHATVVLLYVQKLAH